MDNPITNPPGLRKGRQVNLGSNIMEADLKEIRLKIQCLQRYFLEQLRERLATDSKEVKIL